MLSMYYMLQVFHCIISFIPQSNQAGKAVLLHSLADKATRHKAIKQLAQGGHPGLDPRSKTPRLLIISRIMASGGREFII